MSQVENARPSLAQLVPEGTLGIAKYSRKAVLESAGAGGLAEALRDVLNGGNIRAHTEALTQKRIALLNRSLRVTLENGEKHYSPEEFLSLVAKVATAKGRGVDSSLRIYARWLLGLTEKQINNIHADGLDAYIDELVDFSGDGNIAGLAEATDSVVERSWEDALYRAVGAQTLATRGSDKSGNGKLFEQLVLAAACEAWGFTQKAEPVAPGDYGLSSVTTGVQAREADGTLVLCDDLLVRIDIGFIGEGNPEIVRDKMTRFGREENYLGRKRAVHTFIIADNYSSQLAVPADVDVFSIRGGSWSDSWLVRAGQKLHDLAASRCADRPGSANYPVVPEPGSLEETINADWVTQLWKNNNWN